MQSNLRLTEAEVDEMLTAEAIGWVECWRDYPPPGESLARIAAGLGVWEPPKQQMKPSSEQELLAFAMFAQATMGK